MIDNILKFVSVADAVIFAGGLLLTLYLFVRGIAPVLWRLGNGLARRKIAIFAKGDNAASLENLLSDSKLFRPKNIIKIHTSGDIARAEPASVYLMLWHDWSQDDIKEILWQKPDRCALVVYAPYDKGPVPREQMVELDGKRNTTVTNFRGRLLNDVVLSMITTSYEDR